jgi:hypothetical protein
MMNSYHARESSWIFCDLREEDSPAIYQSEKESRFFREKKNMPVGHGRHGTLCHGTDNPSYHIIGPAPRVKLTLVKCGPSHIEPLAHQAAAASG